MRKYCLLALFLALISSVQSVAQSTGLPEVTLYSPIKYEHSYERALFNFETGSLAPPNSRWDLNYGSLYAGEEHDWLQVSTAKDCRSAIRDLGALSWTDSFEVPAVEPFPKLKEGEQRKITVNTSGADGKPGASGGGIVSGPVGGIVLHPQQDAFSMPPVIEPPLLSQIKAAPSSPVQHVKQDGVPKIDPIFVKAVVGHIYAIHVVDGDADYYALFRVESVVRGDHCTISWKLIPPPENRARN
jgi:hypothetical protein